MHILVVDDDSVVRMSMRTMLTAEGYKVTTADDGERAVLKLSEEKFDLVICDIYMPHIDGRKLRSIAREMPLSTKLPILFISGHDDSQTQNVVHDNLIEGFFKKGKPIAELLAWVKYLTAAPNKRPSLAPNVASKAAADHHYYGRTRERGSARPPMV
jgi:DNA-binding response OmpR family regulator